MRGEGGSFLACAKRRDEIGGLAATGEETSENGGQLRRLQGLSLLGQSPQ